jgi:hypothetical protein
MGEGFALGAQVDAAADAASAPAGDTFATAIPPLDEEG